MPINVDVQQRLDELAVATLAVVQRDGLGAVTIRSVARELGRSTAVVTNYLPTRAELVLNAFRHGRRIWERDLAQALAGLEGFERLQRAVAWWCSREPLDDALRQLWLEILLTAGSDDRFAELISDLGTQDQAYVREVTSGLDGVDDALVADALLLTLRGFWVSMLENSDDWTPERGMRAAEAVASALLGSGSASTGR